jgi:hypothetical protein
VIVRTNDKGTIIALEREKKVGEDRVAAMIPTGVSTAKKFAKELLPIIMGLESIKYKIFCMHRGSDVNIPAFSATVFLKRSLMKYCTFVMR